MLSWYSGGSPTAPSAWWVSLHTGDPGDKAANAAATEPSGTGGYARVQVNAVGGASPAWDTIPAPASAGDPAILANLNAVPFDPSSAAWSTGATNLTYFALWTSSTLQTEAAFLGRAQLSTPQNVNAAGVTLSFAIGALQISMDDT
jgi:hypothetical protein